MRDERLRAGGRWGGHLVKLALHLVKLSLHLVKLSQPSQALSGTYPAALTERPGHRPRPAAAASCSPESAAGPLLPEEPVTGRSTASRVPYLQHAAGGAGTSGRGRQCRAWSRCGDSWGCPMSATGAARRLRRPVAGRRPATQKARCRALPARPAEARSAGLTFRPRRGPDSAMEKRRTRRRGGERGTTRQCRGLGGRREGS